MREPLGGLDPLHRDKPHEHWVELRSNPLQKPLQTVTRPVTLGRLMRSESGQWIIPQSNACSLSVNAVPGDVPKDKFPATCPELAHR